MLLLGNQNPSRKACGLFRGEWKCAAAKKGRIDGGEACERFGEALLQRIEAGPALDAFLVEIKPAIDFDLQAEQPDAAAAIQHGGIATGIGRVARGGKAPADKSI